jgi:alpha/beta superfamily hydrolase
MPCVIYLHGNASSRLEVLTYLKYLLPLNITVFAFDFTGSGNSDGKYISLGYHEREDLKIVI